MIEDTHLNMQYQHLIHLEIRFNIVGTGVVYLIFILTIISELLYLLSLKSVLIPINFFYENKIKIIENLLLYFELLVVKIHGLLPVYP